MKRWVMIAALALLTATAFAAETAAEVIVSGVLAEIRQTQGVPANGRIDCDKVTPAQYERLGVAVMDLTFPDTADHAWMDNMMGGPTTELARAMHRMIGARYLGCPYGGRAGFLFGWPGMMGGGMMGYGYGMMGGRYGQPGAPVTMWILVIIVVVLIIAFVVLTAVRLSRRSATEAPIDILIRRYARGDITREQYEQMKKDLTR